MSLLKNENVNKAFVNYALGWNKKKKIYLIGTYNSINTNWNFEKKKKGNSK